MSAWQQEGGAGVPASLGEAPVRQVGSDTSTEANLEQRERQARDLEKKKLFMRDHRKRCKERKEMEALEAAKAEQAEWDDRYKERYSRMPWLR